MNKQPSNISFITHTVQLCFREPGYRISDVSSEKNDLTDSYRFLSKNYGENQVQQIKFPRKFDKWAQIGSSEIPLEKILTLQIMCRHKFRQKPERFSTHKVHIYPLTDAISVAPPCGG